MSVLVEADGAGDAARARRAPRRPYSDNPEAYIAGDRRRALAAGIDMPDRVSGTAIFADISGFTPLTEALAAELGPQRGAEELTAALNAVFGAVLGELHRDGGSVIYFSGDAVTCWLDGDDGLLGVSCALAMQAAMAKVCRLTTPGGTEVELGMKVAVSAGPARRFVVGDPEIQLIDVLAGSLMDRLAAAEHDAERGQVVVDATTGAALRGRVELVPAAASEAGTGIVRRLLVPVPAIAPPRGFPRLPRAVVRQWLLTPVYERIRTGRGEFLAELRPAVPMFVRFGGIDYDGDEEAPRLLDDFIRRAQLAIDSHGGNVLQLTIGDKGAYLYAVFGSPLAHEDDEARACAAAFDVLALEGETAATGLQVGIASGRLRSGTYGERRRRTFCCLGDAVNLAARLMSNAAQGQTYTTQEVERASRGRFAFEDAGVLSLKGKSAPVPARRLTGPVVETRTFSQYAGRPLLGRAAELDLLVGLAERAVGGEGQVVGVTGEPGTGKSHLTSVLSEELASRDVPVLLGAAASVGAATSYLAWRSVVGQLLGVREEEEAHATGSLVARLAGALGALDAGLVPRLPLLGAVFGCAIDDTELTAGWDAKLRKASLESLVVQVLTRRCEQSPVAVVLEDCHWIDPLSQDLLDLVARAAASLPVLLLMTYRPGPFAAPPSPHTTVVQLEGLDDEHSRALLAAVVESIWEAGTVMSEPVADRLVARAEGNPLFLEEIARYLHDRGADPSDSAVASLELPTSLSSLILSSIDTLAELPRRTLKVASVVGREFAVATLVGAYPDLGATRGVAGHLRALRTQGLVVDEGEASDRFSFRHAMVQEVAYESLPFALRAKVHAQVGNWLESTEPEALDLLAHHFWNSREEDKKREYLLRAGAAAKARFANDSAIDYFTRLAPIVEGEAREHALCQLGAVLEVHGDQAAAERAYDEELQLVEARGDLHAAAWTRVRRCTPIRRQGLFQRVVDELDVLEPVFQSVGDVPGMAKAAHIRGLIANQTGTPEVAWEHFQRSLEMRRSLGDKVELATTLGNLGVAAAQRGDHDLARQLTEESLALRIEIGDRRNVSVSHNNLGMIAYLQKEYSRAVPHLEAGVSAGMEIGALYTATLAQHNLANCARELGQVAMARRNYEAALRACAIVGDQQWLCQLLEDISMLVVDDHPEVAFELLGAADSLRKRIGSPRLGFEEATIDEHLADRARLLGGRAANARRRGARMGADRAARIAMEICAVTD